MGDGRSAEMRGPPSKYSRTALARECAGLGNNNSDDFGEQLFHHTLTLTQFIN
jgi:hypothetical protein